MRKHSEITSVVLSILYPFIVLFGFYLIYNGHITPGGGFQGGAVLTFIFISAYIIDDKPLQAGLLRIFEKVLYIVIVVAVCLFLFIYKSLYNEYFLILINILIGIKVFCGLSLIFLIFASKEM